MSNEYKGDNITNLTVEPSLVPFDTFDSLVENKFDIISRRWHLSDTTFMAIKQNTYGVINFFQENRHEVFP